MPSAAGRERPADEPVRIGVLAMQGGFSAHIRHLASVGAKGTEIRTPADLEGLDGLVIPGGESTTISMGIERDGLDDAIGRLAGSGIPVLGTCAGMILLGSSGLDLIDIETRRNAFGRQLASFEQDLEIRELAEDPPFRAVFIRAPWVERVGGSVEVLAKCEGHPVAVRQGDVIALAFHPELSGDDRIHGAFAEICAAGKRSADG